jgi:aspartokinase/homoserine dehydrogenase 1
MVGVARRIFEATESSGANVVMISQASSEQTVSLVVGSAAVSVLVSRLEAVFELEIRAGLIAGIGVRTGVAILSIIGQGMAGKAGISGKLFGALGAAGVNVGAIAQGASELSISVAIDDGEATRAVRAVHTAFGLTRVVHVMMIGCGRVGQSLLTLVDETRAALAERDLELRVIGVARSRTWWMQRDGVPQREVARPNDDALVAALVAERFTDLVVVDVTASPLSSLHLSALRAGFHVVTANKIPLSGSLASYQVMVDARDAHGVRYEYETTFGAGLPVLHTLKELVHTGDEVVRVTGCFSGTLGFVCTRLGEGASLADAVGEAKNLGYTEPDPREDLSGRDVARKALIIARAMGRQLEPEDVALDALVPGLDAGLDVAIAEFSPVLAARISSAADRGAVLRYVASIDAEGVSVGLREVPSTGPIGSLRGPDNILVFESRRYATYPLVIRGPGAGAEVTAAGVLGDLLKVARSGT